MTDTALQRRLDAALALLLANLLLLLGIAFQVTPQTALGTLLLLLLVGLAHSRDG